MESVKVASLYCFAKLNSVDQKRKSILEMCEELDIKGLIILAEEGINGTISGDTRNVERVIKYLKKIIGCSQFNLKEHFTNNSPFGRIKVKVKREIVTSGMREISSNDETGKYVEPSDWDDLINQDNVVTIDTRNDYEVAIGSFKGAVNPHTKSFADFPRWWKKNNHKYEGKSIAMFCTGGIRCEKSTKFLLKYGVEEVYHLKGGILNYFEAAKGNNQMWEGECFVFDQRVSVAPNLEQGSHLLCFACRYPLSRNDLTHEKYEEGVSCHHCYKITCNKRKKSFRERQKQIKLADLRGEKHLKYY